MPLLRYDPTNDYYHLLGVPASASAGEIQRAFHRLAKELHPDRNPDRLDWAKQRFQGLNEAYAVLGDPIRRRTYDRLRWPHLRPEEHRAARSSHPYDATAETDHAQAAPGASWRYGDWVRHDPPPPPDRPLTPTRGMSHTLTALLRGPFGSIYVVLMLTCLLLPVSYFVVTSWVSHVTLVPARAPAGFACEDPAVTITTPDAGASVPPTFTITGVANPPGFEAYRLEIAFLEDSPEPSSTDLKWHLLRTGQIPVVEGALATAVDLSGEPAGYYVLRLSVQTSDGAAPAPCERLIVHDMPAAAS